VSEATMLLSNSTLDSRQQEILKLLKEENSYAALIELVHKQQVDINFYDEQGKTPLITAIEKSDSNFVRVLIKYPNINMNMSDSNGYPPLIKSIISNRGPDRLRIIVYLIRTEGFIIFFDFIYLIDM